MFQQHSRLFSNKAHHSISPTPMTFDAYLGYSIGTRCVKCSVFYKKWQFSSAKIILIITYLGPNLMGFRKSTASVSSSHCYAYQFNRRIMFSLSFAHAEKIQDANAFRNSRKASSRSLSRTETMAVVFFPFASESIPFLISLPFLQALLQSASFSLDSWCQCVFTCFT